MDSARDSRYPARLESNALENRAPVAQLDRVLPSEGRGHTFESCRARHELNGLDRKIWPIFVLCPAVPMPCPALWQLFTQGTELSAAQSSFVFTKPSCQALARTAPHPAYKQVTESLKRLHAPRLAVPPTQITRRAHGRARARRDMSRRILDSHSPLRSASLKVSCMGHMGPKLRSRLARKPQTLQDRT